MTTVKKGQYVQVHYTGTLDDGTLFDSSEGRPPLEFQTGRNQVIPGFEEAVMSMALNDERSVTIPAEQAYGEIREDLVRDFPIGMLGGETVEVGQPLWFRSPNGPIQGKVTALDAEKFTVDFNHPLAGQTLHFKLKLVGITDEPTQQPMGCSCSSGSCDTC
jgi:peptidylprolyl isomerase